MASAPAPQKPKGWRLFKLALQSRKSATMLGFGFSSGLPYALLIGTLNAWLGEVKIDLATIGVLSWIGLSYSFKFLWSPLVDRLALPGLERLGRRKSWIALCQGVLVLSFAGLAATDPTRAIGTFALFAFLGALASATQDVAIDAWRIDVADEQASVELLSSIYQFGYRIASIVGGALALVMAGRMSWPLVYLLMAGLIGLVFVVTLRAPDTPRAEQGALHATLGQVGELNASARTAALAVVGASWAWAIATIVLFMVKMLSPLGPGEKHPSVASFTRETGPLIVLATVAVPLLVSAVVNALKTRQVAVLAAPDMDHGPVRTAMNHLYVALVAPLAELVGRLRWGVLIVVGMILTYTLCYNMWASFAFPFYLEFLHYSKDEVAFASKLFGIFMTIAGISLGGFLFVRLGRMPTILIGAVLPILGNFVYADLAEGAPLIDRVGHAIGLHALFGAFGFDDRMVRLLLAISFENISTGIAGAAFVAYMSGIVSRSYTAVQYALLSSLTFLIGSLGRGIAGEAFDLYGYATVFRYAALAGGLAVVFVLLEWARVSRGALRVASHHPPTPSSEEEGE
ncbi:MULTISPECIES: MFS transporter [unclassified Novosphingobium]|uniref:AmpG family muropeptide MFS transporter n=1 Tax=unclassified Novosphingobium TaxID=2644732 RepID=UPI0018444887|nr:MULTISPECIES: MFS transporter [unclassified Novosphingobium]NMN03500.1 PAT family beta-lactamase induction signal transducer AmpG [Novosphingobium sp. SG919]NMN86510.1 PAT family beta-lactamase induction signal transducer AmpG [Novosphingobium sp. SG916]